MSLAKSSDINILWFFDTHYSTKLDKIYTGFEIGTNNNFHTTLSLEVQSRTRTETKSTSEFGHVEYSSFFRNNAMIKLKLFFNGNRETKMSTSKKKNSFHSPKHEYTNYTMAYDIHNTRDRRLSLRATKR